MTSEDCSSDEEANYTWIDNLSEQPVLKIKQNPLQTEAHSNLQQANLSIPGRHGKRLNDWS